MEKKMETEMETGGIEVQGYRIGFRVFRVQGLGFRVFWV